MSATLLAALLATSPAHAFDATTHVPIVSSAAAPDDGGGVASTTSASQESRLRYEVSFRFRRMQIPQEIMDAFFTRDLPSNDGWPLRDTGAYCTDNPGRGTCGSDRPSLEGFAYGLELLIKARRGGAVIWFDYADANMVGGYWDDGDQEGPNNTNDPFDGDYIRPGRDLGLVMFGVDYQFELPAVKLEKTKGIFGLDFIVGTGIGLGIMVGELDQWAAVDGAPFGYADSAFDLFDRGVPPDADKQVNRFWPVVDLNLGFKLNFADRVSLRLEGGLHTMLYYGATLGFRF
ncbi:MAG: hypothetical protein H6732_08670 [Alphaproteobacteria bacterium]|nr:hypothetical protein [Alphaproteobacteria bacterium]